MATFTLKAGGVQLPAPVDISDADQIIWSGNTGRTSSGKMTGTVVTKKKSFDIKWGILSASEVSAIRAAMPAGFFEVQIQCDDEVQTLNVYRGAFQKEVLGYAGSGTLYYRSMTVSLIEQ